MMFYDRQTDKLYTEDTVMEGIFSKIKEKVGNKAKGIIEKNNELRGQRNVEDEEASKPLKLEIDKAVKVVKSFIKKAEQNPKWKHLILNGEYDEYPSGKNKYVAVFYIFDDEYIFYPKDSGYEPDAEECFNFILNNSKKEINKINKDINVEVNERVDITISLKF